MEKETKVVIATATICATATGYLMWTDYHLGGYTLLCVTLLLVSGALYWEFWGCKPKVSLCLIPAYTLSTGNDDLLICSISVENTGPKIIHECYPVLNDYPESIEPQFNPWPLTWDFNPDVLIAGDFTTRNINRGEKIRLVIACTSRRHSIDDGSGCFIEIPTARKSGEHYITGLPPGNYEFSIKIEGANIKSKPLKLRSHLEVDNENTWETMRITAI